MSKVYVIAELGINHNGSLDLAIDLMRQAKRCGADAVKFQIRTVGVVYTPEELAQLRPITLSRRDGGPWSGQTNGEWKQRLEFGVDEYNAINTEAKCLGLEWSASCWDAASIEFMASYRPRWLKIPSALITDARLVRCYARTGLPIIMSTGMSTWEEIDSAMLALALVEDVTLLHCHSSYPSPLDELNLACIRSLQERYPGVRVGYSSHTVSPWPCLMAAVYGADVIEAHLT